MKSIVRAAIAVVLFYMTGPLFKVHAEELISFDSIVDNLENSSRATVDAEDPFDSVLIHAGLGLVGSYMNIGLQDGASAGGTLNGIEARFGIDLFSPYWQAIGAIRSFDEARLSATATAGLKEFDLSLSHSSPLTSRLALHLGGGLAARYLKVTESRTGTKNYTTPASILAVGLSTHLTERVGISTDLSWRRAMIDETADHSAVQAGVSMNAQF